MGRRLYFPKASGFDDTDDDYPDDDFEDEAPCRRSVPEQVRTYLTRQQDKSTGLQLPFNLTFERMILLALMAWMVWRLFKRARKAEKRIKRLSRAVKALQSERVVIDV